MHGSVDTGCWVGLVGTECWGGIQKEVDTWSGMLEMGEAVLLIGDGCSRSI